MNNYREKSAKASQNSVELEGFSVVWAALYERFPIIIIAIVFQCAAVYSYTTNFAKPIFEVETEFYLSSPRLLHEAETSRTLETRRFRSHVQRMIQNPAKISALIERRIGACRKHSAIETAKKIFEITLDEDEDKNDNPPPCAHTIDPIIISVQYRQEDNSIFAKIQCETKTCANQALRELSLFIESEYRVFGTSYFQNTIATISLEIEEITSEFSPTLIRTPTQLEPIRKAATDRLHSATVAHNLWNSGPIFSQRFLNIEQKLPGFSLSWQYAFVYFGTLLFITLFFWSEIFGVVTKLSSETILNSLGFPVLGKTLQIRELNRRPQLLEHLILRTTSPYNEIIRDIRTSLLTIPNQPPATIMITSSVPGDGKTTFAISIAKCLAESGSKVLLVDGDLRRRTLDHYFPKGNEQANLISVISGDRSLQESTVEHKELGIHILHGANTTRNAADIFMSDGFSNFLETAKASFDHIVIDTPPAKVVSDPFNIARNVDAAICAIRWGKSHPEMDQEVAIRLQAQGIPFVGLVATQFRSRVLGFNYPRGNGYTYGTSYEENSSTGPKATLTR